MRMGKREWEKGKGQTISGKPAHYGLRVWQDSISLVKQVFTMTRNFPSRDQYVLGQHMQKTAISIPSNVAEGAARGSLVEYARFLRIARGSLMELDTQVRIGNPD